MQSHKPDAESARTDAELKLRPFYTAYGSYVVTLEANGCVENFPAFSISCFNLLQARIVFLDRSCLFSTVSSGRAFIDGNNIQTITALDLYACGAREGEIDTDMAGGGERIYICRAKRLHLRAIDRTRTEELSPLIRSTVGWAIVNHTFCCGRLRVPNRNISSSNFLPSDFSTAASRSPGSFCFLPLRQIPYDTRALSFLPSFLWPTSATLQFRYKFLVAAPSGRARPYNSLVSFFFHFTGI